MPAFLDAAYQILKDTNQSMTAEEITQQALDRGFLVTKGKTPAATMSASIYMDIKEKGAASRFVQTNPNRFAINKEPKAQHKPDFKTKSKVNKASGRHPLVQADSAHKLLDHDLAAIRAFLSGLSTQLPTSEKLCDWVTMCYTFELYSEGVDLFGFVDLLDVNEWYYARTKKLARLCALHQEGSNHEKV